MSSLKKILALSLVCINSMMAIPAEDSAAQEMDKVAFVAVDTQNCFAATQKAKEYNRQQARLLMKKKYPGISDLDLDNIEKDPKVAFDMFSLNGWLTTNKKTGKQEAILYTYGLPVDDADEMYFAQEAKVLAWSKVNGVLRVRTGDDHTPDSLTFAITHNVPELSELPVEGIVHRQDSCGTKTCGPTKEVRIQTVWPAHGISNTWGAKWVNPPQNSILAKIVLFNRLVGKNDLIQCKGQTNEAYSAAKDTYGNDLGFIKKLNDQKVGAVIIGGLAGGHCVDATALDLATHGKKEVAYVLNHTRWLRGLANNVPSYRKKLVDNIREMHDAGVIFYAVEEGSALWVQKDFVLGLCQEAGARVHTVKAMDDVHKALALKLSLKKARSRN
jgi:nicotinamidase-related amidase